MNTGMDARKEKKTLGAESIGSNTLKLMKRIIIRRKQGKRRGREEGKKIVGWKTNWLFWGGEEE